MLTYLRYAGLFVLGFIFSVLSLEQDQMREVLFSLQAISVVALVASLLVPFAGFSEKEQWNKDVLVHVPYLLFGVHGGMLGWQGNVILAIIASMHIAYWQSGLHSRGFRLRLFLNLSNVDQETKNQVLRLVGSGRSGEADEIVKRYLKEDKG